MYKGYFVEVQTVERQNAEIQIVDMKTYKNLLMYPNMTWLDLTHPNLLGYHITPAVGT
jgi:hypothetical protein